MMAVSRPFSQGAFSYASTTNEAPPQTDEHVCSSETDEQSKAPDHALRDTVIASWQWPPLAVVVRF